MADRVLKQLVILVDAGRLDQVCAPHLAPPSMPEECIGVRELHMLAEQLYAFGRPGGSKPFPDSVLDAIKVRSACSRSFAPGKTLSSAKGLH
jgi:hypothetical protein